MSVYNSLEWAGFVAEMRANPDEQTTPLVAADWLDDHGKGDHGAFIRGCVELNRLLDIYRASPLGEPDYLTYHKVRDTRDSLRPLINRYCHEWTGGTVRRFENPSPNHWPLGFIRAYQSTPKELLTGRIQGLLRRQPVRRVICERTRFEVADHADRLSRMNPGVEFTIGGVSWYVSPVGVQS